MITLHCTKKLQRHLDVKPEVEELEPTAALGDWYGNLVAMPGEPFILLANERSMLCLVLRPDEDPLAALGRRAAALLRRLGLPDEVVEREALELRRVRVGKTKNRRVLGSMNDAVLQIEGLLFDDPQQGTRATTLVGCSRSANTSIAIEGSQQRFSCQPATTGPHEGQHPVLAQPGAPRRVYLDPGHSMLLWLGHGARARAPIPHRRCWPVNDRRPAIGCPGSWAGPTRGARGGIFAMPY